MDTSNFYIPITLCFILSEILPYISHMQHVGVINLFVNTFNKVFKHNTDENQLLLEENNNNNVNNIENILSDYLIQKSQVKLQCSGLYELNFIINYIKTNYLKKNLQMKYLQKSSKDMLLSQGYIIEYDSLHDISIIKW